jgi:hypothetical protein
LKEGIRKVTTRMCSNRREELSRRIGIDNVDVFCDVLHAKTPHNTAGTSIIVSMAHAMVETTSSSDNSLARKQYSSLLMSMED